MSRKAEIIEEFDDDTDLPLPSLPNTGSRGPLLEELHISDDEFEPSQRAGPASTPFQPKPTKDIGNLNPKNAVTDITPYKTWTCLYPIYFDAKRPYGTGQRRLERPKSLWYPLSKDIAEAANRLGLGTLHEVNKAHPRDWENPGRVRVQWKKEGKLMNPTIKTKKQLLEMISFQIQHLKPENVPRAPYSTATALDSSAIIQKASASSTKGKQPATTKSKPTASPTQSKPSGRQLPVPPEPQPSLADRVSAYSPAISSGVLIEAVKAGMNAVESNPAIGAAAGTANAQGGQKGKRKVVRVRA